MVIDPLSVLSEVARARQAVGEPSRVAGIGGGADLQAEVAGVDTLYPPSLNGSWLCTRTVTSVEGDAPQAEGAWRLLGGEGDFRQAETYRLRYVDQPDDGSAQPITGIDGRQYYGVVLDRGYELAARMRGAADDPVTESVRAHNY